MRVKCEKDNTIWDVIPHIWPCPEFPMPEKWCEENDYTFPCKVIMCPTCARSYFKCRDGIWKADRPLTILKDEYEKPIPKITIPKEKKDGKK